MIAKADWFRSSHRLMVLFVLMLLGLTSLILVQPAFALQLNGGFDATITCANWSHNAYTVVLDRNTSGAGQETIIAQVTDGDGTVVATLNYLIPLGSYPVAAQTYPFTATPDSDPLTLTVRSPAGGAFAEQIVHTETFNCGFVIDDDSDTYSPPADCDDTNPAINPGATDIPGNGIDEDCSGADAVLDADTDGYSPPADCDDANPAINPGETDIHGNGIDEDCDGADAVLDADTDGYSPPADCDDANPAINPGETDIPGNGIDEDCSGADAPIDNDTDGYSPPVDCDDADGAINPGAVEIPGNGIDENCDGADGVVDNDTDGYSPPIDCDDANPAINPGATDIPGNGVDEDCSGADAPIDNDTDGYSPPVDCDDADGAINPGATDVPGNGIDENCDGADGIVDNDTDGYSPPIDCDDADAAINPGATDIPGNGIDENCDGADGVVPGAPKVQRVSRPGPPFNPSDDRVNREAWASVTIHCRSYGIHIYAIDSESNGTLVLIVTPEQIAAVETNPAQHTLIASVGSIELWRLTDGQMYVTAPGLAPEPEKPYIFVWAGCNL
jgi:hypothetical protein